MSRLSLRPTLSRAGIAAFVVAVVGLAGYGIGRTESPGAVASAAAPAAPVASVQGASPSSYAAVVDAVAPAVVTVRVEKRASAMDTQLSEDDLFRFFGRELQIPRQRAPRRSSSRTRRPSLRVATYDVDSRQLSCVSVWQVCIAR